MLFSIEMEFFLFYIAYLSFISRESSGLAASIFFDVGAVPVLLWDSVSPPIVYMLSYLVPTSGRFSRVTWPSPNSTF